jgi:hypothetical protein
LVFPRPGADYVAPGKKNTCLIEAKSNSSFIACPSTTDFDGAEFWVDFPWTGWQFNLAATGDKLISLDFGVGSFIKKPVDFFTVRKDNSHECVKATYTASDTTFTINSVACSDMLDYFCYQHSGVTENMSGEINLGLWLTILLSNVAASRSKEKEASSS